MAGDFDPTWILEVERKLHFIARERYRIRRQEATDLVQATIETFLEVRSRYPRTEEHPRIVVGIFRNKCREHIERAVRSSRRIEELRREVEAGTADLPAIRAARRAEGGLVEDLIRREQAERILHALAALRPEAREMFRLITQENLSRKQLIERLGLNPATLDSRLILPNELKRLQRRGPIAPAGRWNVLGRRSKAAPPPERPAVPDEATPPSEALQPS
jgi:RNA polymerase sigma factor (sigma-70 family)